MNQDEEHLKLLSVFHYVVAAFAGMISLFPLIHLAIGIGMLTGSFPPDKSGSPMPAFMGLFFIGMASVFILCGLSLTVCLILAGRNLAAHRRYVFCLVVAALSCLLTPFGTVLGIFTILVLMRPSVRVLFGQTVPPLPAPPAET